MRLLKINKVNTLLIGIMMTAVLLCQSSPVIAAVSVPAKEVQPNKISLANNVDSNAILNDTLAGINIPNPNLPITDALIKAIAKEYGLDLTDYNLLADKRPVLIALNEIPRILQDKAAFKACFDDAVAAEKAVEAAATAATVNKALYAINNATLAKMGAAISANAKALGLDLTDYRLLTNKTPVHQALVGKNFPDKEGVQAAFNDAVAVEKAKEAAIAEAKALNAINKATLAKMGAAILANAKVLGLDLTDYRLLKDKTSVHQALVGKNFPDIASVKTAFDAAVATEKAKETAAAEAKAVNAINSATLAKMGAAIIVNAKVLGLDLTNYRSLFDKTPVHQAMVGKNFPDKVAVKTAFDAAVETEKAKEVAAAEAKAVQAINSATLAKMGAAITANAKVLGLDLTNYRLLSDKTPVHQALVGKNFPDKEAVETAFDDAVATEIPMID